MFLRVRRSSGGRKLLGTKTRACAEAQSSGNEQELGVWAEPGERENQQARPGRAGPDDRKPRWVVPAGHEGLLRLGLCFSRRTLAELEGRLEVGDGGWAGLLNQR